MEKIRDIRQCNCARKKKKKSSNKKVLLNNTKKKNRKKKKTQIASNTIRTKVIIQKSNKSQKGRRQCEKHNENSNK